MKPSYCLLSLLLLLSMLNCQSGEHPQTSTTSSLLVKKSTIIINQGGKSFRDLNHNGTLDTYEDANPPIEARIEDLIQQMNQAEKAGMLFMNGAPVSTTANPDSKEGAPGPAARMNTAIFNMDSLKMTHFNIWNIPEDPNIFARWYNKVQQHAEKSRLGIPITISSDPRHHAGQNVIGLPPNGFSPFCELPGFAAIGDAELVRQFADVVRKEYLAIGIREALHPQIDLATEPRWARISGNFSEDAELTARLVKPYIEGLQSSSLAEGVACMTKHFPGGGPQKEGLDPHFSFQKGQIYPGGQFDYHLIPFEAAFEAKTAAIMPYYGIPTDQTDENVAMSYNKTIITTLLREKYQYEGVVCTDWGLLTDVPFGPDVVWKARAWGVEELSEADRVLKILNAGVDQFGGENRPELVLQLLTEGRLSEERIDQSLRRLLRQKFALGLFDQPFVDETKVDEILQDEASMQLAHRTQKEAMTLLKNEQKTLPLSSNKLMLYIENIDSNIVAQYGQVVPTPEEADLAIIRINTPWYPVDTKNPLALSFHHGDLDFKGEELNRLTSLFEKVPTVVNIYLDRPAVIPEIAAGAAALIADFGASDASVCAVLFGEASPKGKLPFELPSSMEAVRNQKTDVPYDSVDPLFEFGFGLEY